jgi:hypothetical protein
MNLKSCPFCGGQAEANTDAYLEKIIKGRSCEEPAARSAWVFCTDCGAMGPTINDTQYNGRKSQERERAIIEKAAAFWNHREGESH